MQKNVSFEMEEAVEIPSWASVYPEHKFTVFKACFLSTKPNSHELVITADVLRKYAPTMLGNFLVAKIENMDATTHKSDEIIYGYAPREQEIEFVEDNDVLKAYCYFVVSKRYSKEFNGIFEFNNLRNSSVEMAVETPEDDEHTVLSFDLYGLTTLGKCVNGSCPDADIKMVRFSQKKAEAYFKKDALNMLKQFVDERKQSMTEIAENNNEPVVEMGEIIVDNSEGKEEVIMEEVKELSETETQETETEEKEVEASAVEMESEPEEETSESEKENDDEEEKEAQMSVEELTAKIEQMASDIEARDNIIMENEAELTELRSFKAGVEAKEKAMAVEAVMEEVKTCLSDEQFAQFREEGLSSVEFDAWANKVRATCFSALKKTNNKKGDTVFSFSAPVESSKVQTEPKDVWERLRNQNK